MLLCILTVDKKSISFFSLGIEVVGVGKKVLEVNGGLIQQHTSNGWSIFFSKDLHDRAIDVVADEVVSLLSSQSIKLVYVDLRKDQIHLLLLHHLLLLWIHLLLIWLLPLSWSDLRLRHVGNLLGVVEVGSVLVLVLVVAILLVSLLMMLLILML